MVLMWNADYREPVVAVASFTILYLFYQFGILSPGFRVFINKLRGKRIDQASAVFLQRGAGGLLFGLIPALVSMLYFKRPLKDYGFAFSLPVSSILLIVGVSLLLFPLLFLYTRYPAVNKKIPHAQPERWDALYFLENALSWGFYLVGYEFCLRGFLLFTLSRSMGDWPSIAVVTSIYTCIHIPKGAGEAGGSLLMGVLFGLLSISTKTIWIAIIIHLFIALSTDTSAILHRTRLSKEMSRDGEKSDERSGHSRNEEPL